MTYISKIDPPKCSICGVGMFEAREMHNAEPVREGQCCSSCNTAVVIPARLGELQAWRENRGRDWRENYGGAR